MISTRQCIHVEADLERFGFQFRSIMSVFIANLQSGLDTLQSETQLCLKELQDKIKLCQSITDEEENWMDEDANLCDEQVFVEKWEQLSKSSMESASEIERQCRADRPLFVKKLLSKATTASKTIVGPIKARQQPTIVDIVSDLEDKIMIVDLPPMSAPG